MERGGQSEREQNKLEIAAGIQTYSWSLDGRSGYVDAQRELQILRRKACADANYVDILAWTSSMSMYCAKLIEEYNLILIANKDMSRRLAGEVSRYAKQYFIEHSKRIYLRMPSGQLIGARDWFEYHNYSLYHKPLGSIAAAEADLTKIRRDIALKALAAASVATAEVCRVMHESAELRGVVTGNHLGE